MDDYVEDKIKKHLLILDITFKEAKKHKLLKPLLENFDFGEEKKSQKHQSTKQ